MINSSIISLCALSLMSTSPFYTLYKTHQGRLSTSFFNSRFSHSFNNVIVSYTKYQQSKIHKCVFSYTLNSAIMFTNEGQCLLFENEEYIKNEQIKNQHIYADNYTQEGNSRPSFNNDCGNITITECEFHNCHSSQEGGSLYIHQDCFVIIHETIFDHSSTNGRYGGAAYIVKECKTGDTWSDFKDVMLPQADIRYCCFQDCYPTGEKSDYLYGVALLIAGDETKLYYASTVNCPGFEEGRKKSAGAQFDIQADNVTSKFVNATGGHSQFCAAIEYRRASAGFFKFQTISDMNCMFAISYTDVVMDGLDLSMSNIFNITLKKNQYFADSPFSGLIHVRQTKRLELSQFSFVDITFNTDSDDQSRIVSKGFGQPIVVTLIDCHYSCDDSKIEYNYVENPTTCNLINCHNESEYTNDIPQLNLGDCKGIVTPAPLIDPTAQFSNSDYFSNSEEFSKTDAFSKTEDFSKTKDFSESSGFSRTSGFSNSNDFIETDAFSKTDDFTKTGGFSKSDEFSQTEDFSKSEKFAPSKKFSKSNDFSKTDGFSKTKGFTDTEDFSKTERFTSSKEFSVSKEFTNSKQFDPSPFFVPLGDTKEKGKNVGMIAGIASAAAAAVIAVAIIAFFLIKKKLANGNVDEEIETFDDSTNSINNVNPIYDNNAEDDPFKEDFDA